jgi:inositol-hexakisphosphate kinase
MSTSPLVTHNPSPPSPVRISEPDQSSRPIPNGVARQPHAWPPAVTAASELSPTPDEKQRSREVGVTSAEPDHLSCGTGLSRPSAEELGPRNQRRSTALTNNDRFDDRDTASSKTPTLSPPVANPPESAGEPTQYAKSRSWGKTPAGGLSNLSAHRALLNPSYRDRGGSLEYGQNHRASHHLPPFISPVDSPVDRPSTPNDPNSHFMADPLENHQHHGQSSSSRHGEERAWSIGNERSNSTTRTQGQVEKHISATLANVETTARSRKTSHSLGLFKENATPKEAKRRDDKGEWSGKGGSSESKSDDIYGNAGAETIGSGRSTIRPHHTARSQTVSESETHASRLARALQPMEQQDTLTRASSTPHPLRDSKSTASGENEPPDNREWPAGSEAVENGDAVSIPEQTMANKFPLRLLDEIRNRHNLTPGADRGTSFSRSIPTTISERSRSRSLQRQPWTGDPHEDVKVDPHIGIEDPQKEEAVEHAVEDVEESDHDEIESALYFPHQTPLNNDLDDLESRSDLEEKQENLPQKLTYEALDHHHTEAECAAEREVDISLQTDGENNFLHGDIKVPQTASSETSDQSYYSASEKGFSSASESDYESLDEPGVAPESSFTDDLETTPTATPVAAALITRHKPRHPRHTNHHHVPKAVGAVELKPYKHQVGGHTTVFRFSRRAVCKPLSNRENEFYETVERRHRELLAFLPRYVRFLRFDLPREQ